MPKQNSTVAKSSVFERVQEAINETHQAHANKRPKDAFTLAEYMTEMGLTRSAARRRLDPLVAAGKLRRVKVPFVDCTGRPQTLPGYQLVEPDKGKG